MQSSSESKNGATGEQREEDTVKKFLSKVWNIIRHPRGIFLICFYALFALTVAGTVLLLIFVPEKNALHYILYALSAIELGYFAYTVIVLVVPKIKACATQLLQRHSFTDNILKSYGFRTLAFAAAGFLVNIAYAVLLTVVGIVARSVWNITIAVFYFVLIVLKGIVFFCDRKYKDNTAKQIKIYRACGYMFNLLTVALAGIVILINKADMSYEYAELMIYFVAVYTFCKIISSIVQFFKARKQDILIVQTIRNINLVSAIYSVFVLQVSMIQAFGDGNDPLSNSIAGGVVALLILLVSIYMIVKSHSAEKQISKKE